MDKDQGTPFRPSSKHGLFSSLQLDLKRESGFKFNGNRLRKEEVQSPQIEIKSQYLIEINDISDLISRHKLSKQFKHSKAFGNAHEVTEWMESHKGTSTEKHQSILHDHLAGHQGFAKIENGHVYPPLQYGHYIKPCTSCNKGKVTCYRCTGEGQHNCRHCGGRVHIPCSHCHGACRETCTRCHGSGSVSSTITSTVYVNGQPHTTYNSTRVPCGRCGGAGKIACAYCNGMGREKCSHCDYNGISSCELCSSTGKINCSVCEGSMEVAYLHGWQAQVSVKHEVTAPPDSLMEKVFQQGLFKDIESGLVSVRQTQFEHPAPQLWQTTQYGNLSLGHLEISDEGSTVEVDGYHNGSRWIWMSLTDVQKVVVKEMNQLVQKLKSPWWKVAPWTTRKALEVLLSGRAVHDHWQLEANIKKPTKPWKAKIKQWLYPKSQTPSTQKTSSLDFSAQKRDWILAVEAGIPLVKKQLQIQWMVFFPLVVALLTLLVGVIGQIYYNKSGYLLPYAQAQEFNGWNKVATVIASVGTVVATFGLWFQWQWILYRITPHNRIQRIYVRLFKKSLKSFYALIFPPLITLALILGAAKVIKPLANHFVTSPEQRMQDALKQLDILEAPHELPARRDNKPNVRVKKPPRASEPVRYYGDFPPP